MNLSRLLRSTRISVLTAALFLVSALFFALFVIQYNRSSYTYARLQRVFVPGEHGVALVHPSVAERFYFEPWQPLEQNRSLDRMLERLCTRAGLEKNCARDPDSRFDIFTKEHVIDREDGTSYVLERNAIPVAIDDITPDFLAERMALIGEWAANNQRPDGSLPYLYSPSRGEYPTGSNVIRELITVQGLYAMGRALNDESMTAAAARAERYVFERAYRSEGSRAYMVEEDGEVKLGASGLAVLALREKGGAVSERERLLGEFILSMQNANGSFQTFLQDEPTDENDRFYSGEALTALARLAEATGDEKYYRAIEKSLPYYRSKLEADFYPQYAPWHMQAYAIAYANTGNEEYADYVYWLGDMLIETMLEEDDALPDEEGRFFNPDHPEWGPPHSSSTGIYMEGLTYAYEVAKRRGDAPEMERYRVAILKGTRYLLQVQWTNESAYYLKYPERVIGSFKETITDNQLRIDQAGHAANAFARVYEFVLR